jgi:hypothetical protein
MTIPSSERQQIEQEEFGLYFLVGTNDPAADEVFRIIAREGQTKLSEELVGMIPTFLGSTFRLQGIDIRRASGRIVVYVAGGFTAISNYPVFVRSLELLMRQMEGRLREMFVGQGLQQVSLASGWANLTTAKPRRREPFPAYRGLVRMVLASLLMLSCTFLSTVILGRVLLKGQVDPVAHLIGTSAGWKYDAVYPKTNDAKTVYKLTVKDVPVDAWSITVYNKQGYMERNDLGAYSVNNITAKPNPDGSVTVQFGGCEKTNPNCLPIVPGWNYAVRMYRPLKEIPDWTWKFPEAQPVQMSQPDKACCI